MTTPAAQTDSFLRVDVRSLEGLPPLSPHSQRLMAALGDEEIDVGELAALIEEAPTLAARIVGLARSAWFATPGRVRSVADAIIRTLGLQLAKSLAAGIAMQGTLSLDRCRRFDPAKYWSSALVTATLSRALGASVSDPEIEPDNAYLCGLLHNLGLVALVHVGPEAMDEVFEIAARSPDRSLSSIELDVLGSHHCEVGATLSACWNLPEEVALVIQHHHDPRYRGPDWKLALLVGVASRIGRQLEEGAVRPLVESGSLASLGIDESRLADALDGCRARLDAIAELARVLARS